MAVFRGKVRISWLFLLHSEKASLQQISDILGGLNFWKPLGFKYLHVGRKQLNASGQPINPDPEDLQI